MARDDSGASEAEKVAVMKTLYHEWPGAVSALIADQTSPHGIVFRALLLTAGILSLRADLGALSPGAAGANGPALFHALRVRSVRGPSASRRLRSLGSGTSSSAA